MLDGGQLADADVDLALGAMRRVAPVAPADPVRVETTRGELQRQLAADELTIDAFSGAWRLTDRPVAAAPAM